MSAWTVPLADVIVSEPDIEVVADVYRSGWLSMGPRTEELERRLAGFTGAAHAIAVTNGTAALHLMCLAAGLGPGDEVVVPSLSFVATANAVAYTSATPVFADIVSLDRPWLSCEAVEAAITDRTRAVMNMTYGGHGGDTVALAELCSQRGLTLLEDVAHGLGTRIGDRHAGRFGAGGAFSFFSNKNLAVGEGGAVITDDPDFAARVRLLRSHGMTSLSWDRHKGHATTYDVTARGFNYRIDEPRAALAAARLDRLNQENATRRVLDHVYRDRLREAKLECALPAADGVQAAHHLFCVVLPADADRDEFRAALAERRIQTSVHYPPIHQFSIYDTRQDLPLTEDYARRTVTLPLFAHMTPEQQDLVVDAVVSASREFGE